MFKTRVALLGVLALFIASGIAASTASAAQPAGPYWHVAGSRLGQGAVRQVKFQAKGVAVLKGTAGGASTVVVECHNNYSEGATIEGQGFFQGQDKGRLVSEQCTVSGGAGCTAVVEPIKTTQTKSYLAYNAGSEGRQGKYVDVFEPQQGSVFAVLKVKGNGLCAVPIEVKIEGAVAAEVIPIETESQEGLLNFPEAAITAIRHEGQEKTIGLKAINSPAVFKGAFGARLETNELWGVFGQ